MLPANPAYLEPLREITRDHPLTVRPKPTSLLTWALSSPACIAPFAPSPLPTTLLGPPSPPWRCELVVRSFSLSPADRICVQPTELMHIAMVHWLRRAAARGDADSLYNLAVCYAVRCPSSTYPTSSCIHLPSHLHGCCRRVVTACRGFGIHRMVDAVSHLLHTAALWCAAR